MYLYYAIWYIKSIKEKQIFEWTLSSSIFIFWNKIIVSLRWESYQISCVFLFNLCLSWWLMFIWSTVEKSSGSPVQIFLKHNSKFLEYGSKKRESNCCPFKNIFFASVLLFAHMERFSVSRKRGFYSKILVVKFIKLNS